jgi:hypothetical protein
METLEPKQLAAQLFGQSHGEARSAGARAVRKAARELFPNEAPGKGGSWNLTPDQAAAIGKRLRSN